jgi:hypothetical protein
MPEKTSGSGAEPQAKRNVQLPFVDYPSNSVTVPPSISVIGLNTCHRKSWIFCFLSMLKVRLQFFRRDRKWGALNGEQIFRLERWRNILHAPHRHFGKYRNALTIVSYD